MKRLALALAFALMAAPVLAADAGSVLATAIKGFIVLGYERLGDEAGLMAEKMAALCATPSEENLAVARQRFASLVHAYARVSLIRFGPALADNRLERLFFWPDRKSIALKQVQAVLASGDKSVLSPANLAGKSVGLQGLGALEFVLFGNGSDALGTKNDGFRCGFGGAIAGNIASIGRDLFAAWSDPDGIAARLIDPQAGNPDYRSRDEVLSEFLGLFAHGVDVLRATEIAPILGSGPKDAHAKAGLFWRSGLTVKTLAWQAEGLADLFLVSGLSDLLGADARWLGGSVMFEFDNFSRTSAELDTLIETVLADEKGWGRMSYLRILTTSLEKLFGAQIAGDLGLDLGFSALDGD